MYTDIQRNTHCCSYTLLLTSQAAKRKRDKQQKQTRPYKSHTTNKYMSVHLEPAYRVDACMLMSVHFLGHLQCFAMEHTSMSMKSGNEMCACRLGAVHPLCLFKHMCMFASVCTVAYCIWCMHLLYICCVYRGDF